MSAKGINTHIIPRASIQVLSRLADNGPSTRSELTADTDVHNALRSLKYRHLAESTCVGRTYTWHITPRGLRTLERLEKG